MARKERLSTTDRAAKEWAERVREVCARQPDFPARLALVWRKSKTWGHCPSLETLSGERIAYAGGCDYDKESAALAAGLRFLGATGDEVAKIHAQGGRGLAPLVEALDGFGWILTKVHNGRTEDGFTVTRKATA